MNTKKGKLKFRKGAVAVLSILLVEEIEAEGAVLLKNANSVLPLQQGAKVSLFSRSSVDLVLGGTGAGGIDASKMVDLKTAMEQDEKFDVNDVLWEFYKTYDGKEGYIRSNGSYAGALPEDIYTAEIPQSEYTEDVKTSYENYNDAAIVVISRVGGEGSDMPTGDFEDGTKYLALQEQEKELLRAINESDQFEKTIVLINSSNAMELGWVDEEAYGVDACLWIGGVGQSGARAVADILAGKVNPSGRLADTYAADSFSSPAMQNFGDYTYTNADEIAEQTGAQNNGTKYVVYREEIYVGYRYYETRYADRVINPEGTNAESGAGAYMGDTWDYSAEVCYPFGYGLSYGSEDGQPYTQEIVSAEMTGSVPEQYDTEETEKAGTLEKVVYESRAYATDERKVEKAAYVYLPYGYDENKQYNILYLLHGTGDDEKYWLKEHNENKVMVDQMIARGDIEPLIIVTPTFYVEDDCEKSLDLLTYSFKEELRNDLMPAIESTYSTYAEKCDDAGFENSREHRAFAGLSRGAVTMFHSAFCGSLDYFSWFGAFSGSRTDAEYFKKTIQTEHFKEYPIDYLYVSSGNFDFSLSGQIRDYKNLLEMEQRLQEGVNTEFDVYPMRYHSMGSWHLALYNYLQKIF